MIPLKLKKRTSVDPDVQRGYELMYGKYLRVAGLYPDLVGSKYFWYGIYCSYIHLGYLCYGTGYAVSIYLTATYGAYDILATDICLGIFTYIYGMVAHNFMYKRKQLDYLYKIIGQDFFKYERPRSPREEAIFEKCANDCRKCYRRQICLAVMLFISDLILPVLMPGITGDYGSMEPGEVPINGKLNIPLYLPYDSTGTFSYWFTNAIHCHAGGTECAIVSAVCCIYSNFCITLASQIDFLVASLDDLYERAVWKHESNGYKMKKQTPDDYYNEVEFQKCMNRCLDENIEHIQVINKFYGVLQQVVSPAVFAIFSGSAATICTPMFQLISVVTSKEVSVENVLFGIIYAYAIVCFLMFLGSYCYFGQLLSDSSEKLHYALYNTPWMNANSDFKRKIIISLVNVEKPLVLSAYGLIGASSVTLLDLVRTIFSYLNLLLAAGG